MPNRNETPLDLETRYPYEDALLSHDQRLEDLLTRLTTADKVGLLFHSEVGLADPDHPDQWGRPGAGELVRGRRINHLLVQGSPVDGREIAQWHNRLQLIAMEHPLRIPITFSSDPRHSVTENRLTATAAGAFSQWPEALGIAAAGSAELARQFAEIVRREYIAAGIRVALHPQVDLATEPRWARIPQTFGEDAELTTRMALAYVAGLQGSAPGVDSVMAMGKHFPGGGPQEGGLDPHFSDGKNQVYPGNGFDYHLQPFVALIDAGIAQLMPYYGVPIGTQWEEVGFAYNKGIITDLLRQRLGFDGVVCTDFGIVTGMGASFPARAWGVEHLSPEERIAKLLDCGVDQFGGEKDVKLLFGALANGAVSEAQLDMPLRRLLREKFRLGLFDTRRFVDPDDAAAVIGCADHVRQGLAAQKRSLVLLRNRDNPAGGFVLPLKKGVRVFAEGIDTSAFDGLATVVSDPDEAEVAIIRTKAPDYSDPDRHFLGSLHKGSLEFAPDEARRIQGIATRVPTVLDVYLERPAVLTEVSACAALVGSFGTEDRPFAEVLFGIGEPEGTLPFDLPRSMKAVEESRSDVPFDTADPLFSFGHGLRYRK